MLSDWYENHTFYDIGQHFFYLRNHMHDCKQYVPRFLKKGKTETGL